jgi:hypothetical protein
MSLDFLELLGLLLQDQLPQIVANTIDLFQRLIGGFRFTCCPQGLLTRLLLGQLRTQLLLLLVALA